MSDAWKDRARVKEEEYFERLNREAMERLRAKAQSPKRKSPISGQEMEQLTVSGLVLDRCASGGVFFDKEELERLLSELKRSEDGKAWVIQLLESLLRR